MTCIIVDDDEISRILLAEMMKITPALQLEGEGKNAAEAGALLQKKAIDLMFLDVQLPGTSGFDFMKTLQNPPQIILMSASSHYAVEAFEHSVTDFLVKPIEKERFLKAIKKATTNLMQQRIETNEGNGQMIKNKDFCFIKTENKIVQIRFDEIIYMEADADYMVVHTERNQFVIHGTMKNMKRKLPIKDFCRVHRSFIVNMSKIDYIEDNNIFLPQRVVPIGVSYKPDFLSQLNALML